MGRLRTVTQLGLAGILAAAMMLAFAAVGGIGVGFAHGGGNGHGQGQSQGHGAAGASGAQVVQTTRTNHGATVSQVARSTCTATVPANPSVSNHGQCVRQAAQGQTQTMTETTTTTTTQSAAGIQSAQAGTHQTKHQAKTHHAKHHLKKSHAKHHTKKHHAKG